jgi:cyclohexanone monooxygenase
MRAKRVVVLITSNISLLTRKIMPTSPFAEGVMHQTQLDAIIIGAGFAGMYALHELRRRGFDARAFEKAADVGGVWNWNRYPVARCDVESMQYSYSFSEELQQEWKWSERYSAQPEILKYAKHVADRFDLRRDIRFNTAVVRAAYDEKQGVWEVETDKGERLVARFLIAASGCLSVPKAPEIEGLQDFAGKVYYTSTWPQEGVDFSGQRVGLIGTGSSGVQTISVLADQARQLTVFQRTANYCVPARNGPLTPDTEARWKADYKQLREQIRQSRRGWITLDDEGGGKGAVVSEDERQKRFNERWEAGGFAFLTAFDDVLVDPSVNKSASEFVASKIRGVVKDETTARFLTPSDHPLGTKRMVVETGYYEVYNRVNVKLVNLKTEEIVKITGNGIATSKGSYEFDSLVFSTGFDAMTGALLKMEIFGKDGLSLREKWSSGPTNYLGLMVSGFPNLFMITGPGSPSVLSNMLTAIEQHVEWISRCISHLCEAGISSIEASPRAEDDWVRHVNEVADSMLYRYSNSWYMGSNVKGKPTVFMPYAGGADVYRRKCEAVEAAGYKGFELCTVVSTHR